MILLSSPWLNHPSDLPLSRHCVASPIHRLLGMASAISQYTICSMLLENVQTAHSMIDQAHQEVQHLPWIPRPVLTELSQRNHQMATLRQTVLTYQESLIREVEDAQKELLTHIRAERRGDTTTNEESEVWADLSAESQLTSKTRSISTSAMVYRWCSAVVGPDTIREEVASVLPVWFLFSPVLTTVNNCLGPKLLAWG